MSEWYYTSAGQQVGPVSSAELKQAAQAGRLTPSDLIWKDGMANWVSATKLKGLFDAPAAAAVPVAATAVAAAPLPDVPEAPAADYDLRPEPITPTAYAHQPAQHYAQPQPSSNIGYYNPTAGLGGRVAANLKGFPPPTGPQGDWPLTESHLAQLAAAEKHRKSLRAFNSLCQFLALLSALSTVAALIGVLAGTSRRGPAPTAFMVGQAVGVLIYVALTVLYYMAGKAAMRCRMWGPITVIALISLGIVGTLVAMLIGVGGASTRGPGPGAGEAVAVVMVFGVVALVGGVMLFVAIRGMLAVPKFLASPVWAQEALVVAKL